jgi:hypothetical protein
MAIQSNYPDIRPSLNLDFANTKTLDPRVTFTRASTATYYDGKTVAKAEENLLLNSATLATQNVTVLAQAYTLSFQNTGSVTLSGASTAGPLLGTGVSNRVTLTFTPTAGTLTLTVSGTVTNAQLEARASATAYTPTTTQPITNYIPALQTALAGVPRFEHNPLTGESLGLEIEEQRANLLTYSEQFDNAVWLKTNASVTANTVVAPDGTLTADVLTEDTATFEHRLRVASISKSANQVLTYSIYAKANGRHLNLAMEFGGAGLYTAFNLTTGQFTDYAAATGWTRGTTTLTPVGNGWYRCSISGTTDAGTSLNVRVHLSDAYPSPALNPVYTGNGTSGIYLWGAQLEAGAFATSHVPTVASQVTRSADAASMTGTNFSSWYRQDEGTLYGEGTTISPSWQNALFIDCTAGGMDFNGTSVNVGYSRGVGSSRSAVSINGVAQCDIPIANTNAIRKVALGAAVNNFNAASNGVLGAQDSSGLMPTVNQALIGAANYGLYLNGTIRRLAYYPKRLTNAQLQAITS